MASGVEKDRLIGAKHQLQPVFGAVSRAVAMQEASPPPPVNAARGRKPADCRRRTSTNMMTTVQSVGGLSCARCRSSAAGNLRLCLGRFALTACAVASDSRSHQKGLHKFSLITGSIPATVFR